MRRLALFALAFLAATSLFAQAKVAAAASKTVDCPAFNKELPPLALIQSAGGVLKGTIYTVSEQQPLPNGAAGTTPTCFPQWVRAYRTVAPSSWNPAGNAPLSDPSPGPLLRARVGEMVELTFLNSIDANKFPNADHGCDQTTVYPGTATTSDKAPDCFAGSVMTNIHYHGTHTNPNTTGDNVFLNIRPSPRLHDGTNAPVVTAASVEPAFTKFFGDCEAELKLNPGPKIWPRFWADLPETFRTSQMDLLKTAAPSWYAQNLKLIEQGKWPQYYVGAYPYCFKLPEYTGTTWPPAPAPVAHGAHTGGAGSAEVDEASAPVRPLIMGQSPGTHWYHAHKHGSTTINVNNGMTGVFVIEGQYDDAINAYYGPNWTRTAKVMVINQLGGTPGLTVAKGTGPGPNFTVNSRYLPIVSMKGGEVQMWRIANTSSRAGAMFVAPTSLSWMQLAQDGVQFTNANYQAAKSQSFVLMAGNRADLLVKAPAYIAGGTAAENLKKNTYPVYVYNTVDASDRPPATPAAAQLTLLNVVVTGSGTEMQFMPAAPAFPPFLTDITDKEITGTKVLTFESSAPTAPPTNPAQHTIDGKKFDGEVGVTVGLNKVEEWKVVNKTYVPNQISHPFHIHINPFQISEIFDPNAILSTSPGAGTVTTTTGSSTVTGTGTSFLATFVVGDFIWITGEGPANVTAIASNTSLTFSIAAAGVKNAAYTLAVPVYTINSAQARVGQCVLSATDEKTWHPCSATEPATNRIWWDVFPIPSGNNFYTTTTTGAASTPVPIPGHFKMRSRFVDYFGYYVIHCHILAHEDRGMMTVVEVSPIQTPYSHH